MIHPDRALNNWLFEQAVDAWIKLLKEGGVRIAAVETARDKDELMFLRLASIDLMQVGRARVGG